MTVALSQKSAPADDRLDPFRHRGEYGVDGDFTHSRHVCMRLAWPPSALP
jgi:hypothetical protein